MTDQRTSSEIALDEVEKKLIEAKREAKSWARRGLPVPDHVTRKIDNLAGAATALRKNGENR